MLQQQKYYPFDKKIQTGRKLLMVTDLINENKEQQPNPLRDMAIKLTNKAMDEMITDIEERIKQKRLEKK